MWWKTDRDNKGKVTPVETTPPPKEQVLKRKEWIEFDPKEPIGLSGWSNGEGWSISRYPTKQERTHSAYGGIIATKINNLTFDDLRCLKKLLNQIEELN